MFPVKRVAGTCATSLALLTSAAGPGACGYQPVLSSGEARQGLTVQAAPSLAPDSDALRAALAGARSALGDDGALRPGSGFPRLVIELVRVDQSAAGIVERGDQPASRGTRLGVVVRGWVEEGPGQAPTRVSGDVRRWVTASDGVRLERASLAQRQALERAAHEAGEAIARRVLGRPAAAE